MRFKHSHDIGSETRSFLRWVVEQCTNPGKNEVLRKLDRIIARQEALQRDIDLIKEFLFGEGSDKFVFTTARFSNGEIIKGEISMAKLEFGQFFDVAAAPKDRRGNPASIQAGTAAWSFAGTDANGDDASNQVTVTPDAADELKARVQSVNVIELTGVLTLRADGDPDVDETADVVGTLDIVVDSPNVVAFEITAGPASDVAPTPPPEPAPEP